MRQKLKFTENVERKEYKRELRKVLRQVIGDNSGKQDLSTDTEHHLLMKVDISKIKKIHLHKY